VKTVHTYGIVLQNGEQVEKRTRQKSRLFAWLRTEIEIQSGGRRYLLGGNDGQVVEGLGEELEQHVSADEHGDEALAGARELLAGNLQKGNVR
jgi:hypothetical protein